MSIKPVEVTGLSVLPPYKGYMIMLKERDGKRYLPIFIGTPEAHNISLLLQNVNYVRPLTYELFHNILNATNAKIQDVIVTELKEDTFFAEISLKVGERTLKVDARPSDAIALAIKTKAPIYVDSQVMETAGMIGEIAPTAPNEKDQLEELNKQLSAAVQIEAYEDAAKIRDQIKGLERGDPNY